MNSEWLIWISRLSEISFDILPYLIPILTIFIALYITKQRNKLNIRPHLTVDSEFSNNSKYGINVKNTGKGPAIIESVDYYWDDKIISILPENAIKLFEILNVFDIGTATERPKMMKHTVRNFYKNDSIGTDNSISLIELDIKESFEYIIKYNLASNSHNLLQEHIFKHLKIKIDYKSLAKEKDSVKFPRNES